MSAGDSAFCAGCGIRTFNISPRRIGRLPKVRKINDDQARVARAVLMQPFEELLAIVQRPESISDKNYVEWARQRLDNVFLFYVTLDKRQMRVAAPGFRYHSPAEIHAHAERRVERREQLSVSAAELKNPQAFRDHEL